MDVVILWCDGTDPVFSERRDFFAEKETFDIDNSSHRFADPIDTLRYNLRSIYYNFSSLGKIRLVVDRQRPKWLVGHEQLVVVAHTDFIPKEFLPTFNCYVIEFFLPYISGLSDYFIHGSDDYFMGRALDRAAFLENGLPLIRGVYGKGREMNAGKKNPKGRYGFNKKNTAKFLRKHVYPERSKFSMPIHHYQSYCKATYLEFLERYKSELEPLWSHKFRQGSDILPRELVMHYSLKKGTAVLSEKKFDPKDKDYVLLNSPSDCVNGLSSFKDHMPRLFCVNDTGEFNETHTTKIKELLEYHFPDKAPWER